MSEYLTLLQKTALFVRDVTEENCRGGKLIDFSVSWTAVELAIKGAEVSELWMACVKACVFFVLYLLKRYHHSHLWLWALQPDYPSRVCQYQVGYRAFASFLRPAYSLDLDFLSGEAHQAAFDPVVAVDPLNFLL